MNSKDEIFESMITMGKLLGWEVQQFFNNTSMISSLIIKHIHTKDQIELYVEHEVYSIFLLRNGSMFYEEREVFAKSKISEVYKTIAKFME